ncbi:hypothetical protein DYB28_010155, partial [Aphanomyces astaci]
SARFDSTESGILYQIRNIDCEYAQDLKGAVYCLKSLLVKVKIVSLEKIRRYV